MIVVVGGETEVYAVYKDHLGSITAVSRPNITNQYLETHRQCFDPWGRPRDPNTWAQGGLPEIPQWLFRGYTGHEMIEPFGLVNMNGRCYDPVVGRMLSADPFIASLSSTQAFNRYSYANSNPMAYTDPSGNMAWFVPVLIGFGLGFELGGAGADGWTHLAPWDWDQDAMDSAIGWGIFGAGIGLGVSAGMGLSPAQTGFNPSFSAITNGGTSIGWDVVSNALIAGNVNMLSMLVQRGSAHDVAISGMIGVGAGALGGLTGNWVNGLGSQTAWGAGAINAQAYVTNGLSGFGDRFYRTQESGEGNPWLNGLGGMAEGLYAAHLSIKWGLSNIQHTNGLTESVWGRYASIGASGAITSVPRLSWTLGAWEVEKWIWNAHWNILFMENHPWWRVLALYPTGFGFSLWPTSSLLLPELLQYPRPGRP